MENKVLILNTKPKAGGRSIIVHVIYLGNLNKQTFNSTKIDILGLPAAGTAYSDYHAGGGLGEVVQFSTNIRSVETLNTLEAPGEDYIKNSIQVKGRFDSARQGYSKIHKREFSTTSPVRSPQIPTEKALETSKEILKETQKGLRDLIEKPDKTNNDHAMIQKQEQTIQNMEITIENYKLLLKKGIIDIEGLIESVNNLITNWPQIFEQLATGILTLDPVLVLIGLSNLLPILLKIIGKAAFFGIMRQNQKLNLVNQHNTSDKLNNAAIAAIPGIPAKKKSNYFFSLSRVHDTSTRLTKSESKKSFNVEKINK